MKLETGNFIHINSFNEILKTPKKVVKTLVREDKENFRKVTYKNAIPLQVKRKISAINTGIEYLLNKIYTAPKMCLQYDSYDEFIQVVSEAIAERMYNYFFTDLDDQGDEWEEIYYGILDYVDIAWSDRLEEYFESNCNWGEILKEQLSSPVSVPINLRETIIKVLKESRFLKRRVNAEILEEAISDALNYAIFRFGEKYNRNLNQFIDRVMSVLMDNLHPTLSWGGEEFPYDEIYNFLKEKYSDRIHKRYLKLRNIDPTKLETNESEITERCWKGYTQKGMKTMFGKRYPNCVKKTKK